MSIKPTQGGVCAPAGFAAGGVRCGISGKADKKDLALIYSKVGCTAAAGYTTNKVKAAPIAITRENLVDGKAQAVICNSGNANACAKGGEIAAKMMCELAGKLLNINPADVVVASTGVIGQPLNVGMIEASMTDLGRSLSPEPAGSRAAAHAIMTTDTMEKEIALSFQLGGKLCSLGGIAKGSGMIHPNMATMLAFLTTDAAVSSEMLKAALDKVIPLTFNMVSVDGDTSTNDMCVILANGLAGNEVITQPGKDFDEFVKTLTQACIYLARIMAKDGEGATKLIECTVNGALDDEQARMLAKSVVCSSLLKSAIFGRDANWGRIICALGYSGAQFDPGKVNITLASLAGEVRVCRDGVGLAFSEELAGSVLGADEIEIQVELFEGEGGAVAWGCDLTYDYVKINGDYRS